MLKESLFWNLYDYYIKRGQKYPIMAPSEIVSKIHDSTRKADIGESLEIYKKYLKESGNQSFQKIFKQVLHKIIRLK